MTDIRQSVQFASFMCDLGWQVEKIGSAYIYLKKFPAIGSFAKIPRPKLPIPFAQISNLVKTKRIFQLKIAPFISSNDRNYKLYRQQFLNQGFKTEYYPFNPTTTIQIDLTQDKAAIFQKFTGAKRRGVRRAIKNGVFVKESTDINTFIKIRKKQYFPLGFLMVNEMKKLWKNFYPKNTALLLVYQKAPKNTSSQITTIVDICGQRVLAGILLLFYDNIAYYWHASSLKKGKKLFAPTLLVWEALKISKKRGCRIFDFEGIYDGRFPQAASSWKGFTKFKEGFGGKKIVFIENFQK